MLKVIENITKQTYELQNQHLRLFARVDLAMKLHILQFQKPLFHKLKSAYGDVDNAVITLASLVLSIDAVAKELDLIKLNAMKLKVQPNKMKLKRQKLIDYWAIIKTLRNEQNMSFRQIAKYFQKYHKFEISHSMIQKIWNEIENTGEKYVIN
ncbi:hypothetical protein SUSP_002382 [Sulfurospirillum sp. 'SP']|jgi:hypothetical protein|nr:hypothetical protein [Sulfurospirillum sp. 'SP']WNY99964.1 hypothetical protein SUSP_002382 [Sulfurospirillum sp. 'SP']